MPREDDEGVELEIYIKAKTEKAMLIVYENEEYWLPFSQIHNNSDIDDSASKGDNGTITVTSWWATKESLP